MKKFTTIILTFLLLSVNISHASTIPNILQVKNQYITIKSGEEINIQEHIEIEEGSTVLTIDSLGKDEIGEHEIKILAIMDDKSQVETITFNVLSEEEYEEYINEIKRKSFEERKNKAIAASRKILGDLSVECSIGEDPVATAQCFVGMTGWCTEIAQKFIDAYFGAGYSVFDTYDISYEEALPGDVIYYTDGGLGMQHYAVYLGNDLALQGNMDGGISRLGSIYLNKGSEPQFKRLNKI